MSRSFIALCLLPLLTLACESTRSMQTAEFGRQCPLGNTTEVTVTSDQSPRDFALETAAKATLRDGYEKFRIVRGDQQGDTYIMLIRMVPQDESMSEPALDMVSARDVLAARAIGQSPIL